jgi:hypothetical protein
VSGREPPVAVVEELVHRTGEDHLAVGDEVSHLLVVGVEQHLDVGVAQHPLEHPGVPVLRHHLVGVTEVAVILVGAYGDAGNDRGIELARVQAPLLPGVILEKLLIELAAHPREDHVLRGANGIARLGHLREELLDLHRVEVQPVERVDGGEVDGDGHQLSVHVRADPVHVGAPLGEPGQILEHVSAVGVEDVGPYLWMSTPASSWQS